MKRNYYVKSIIKICLLLFILQSASCWSPQSNNIRNQLDKKVKAVFNENSSIKTFQYAANGNEYLYKIGYESGLSVTLSLTQKSISIVEYQLSPVSKSNSSSKWQTTCAPVKPQIKTQSQITAYLINLKEITSNYKISSFTVLSDGYLVQYRYEEIVYIFELSWDLKIRRRQTQKITPPPSTINPEISVKTVEEIISYLNLNLGLKITQNQIQKIQNLSSNSYLIIIVIQIGVRQVQYSVIITLNSYGKYEVSQSSYNINFTPEYSLFSVNSDQVLVGIIDGLIRQRLSDKLPAGVILNKLERDEPCYRFYYANDKNEYMIECIYDQFMKKINVLSAKVRDAPILTPPVTQPDPSFVQQKTKDEINSFLTTNISYSIFKNSQIQSITRIGTQKYLIVIIIVINQRQIKYQITVNQNSNGSYQIVDGNYSFDFNPSYQQMSSDDETIIKNVLPNLKVQLGSQMPLDMKLIRVWRDEPYYKLQFGNNNENYEVEFTYEPIMKRINIINFVVTLINKVVQVNPVTTTETTTSHVETVTTQPIIVTQQPEVIVSNPSTTTTTTVTTTPIIDMTTSSTISSSTSSSSVTNPSNTVQDDQAVHIVHHLDNSQPNVQTGSSSLYYSQIPDQYFELTTSQSSQLILSYASVAIERLITEIPSLANHFKLSNIYYYVKDSSSIIYKFEILTEEGITYYYYELNLVDESQPQYQHQTETYYQTVNQPIYYSYITEPPTQTQNTNEPINIVHVLYDNNNINTSSTSSDSYTSGTTYSTASEDNDHHVISVITPITQTQQISGPTVNTTSVDTHHEENNNTDATTTSQTPIQTQATSTLLTSTQPSSLDIAPSIPPLISNSSGSYPLLQLKPVDMELLNSSSSVITSSVDTVHTITQQPEPELQTTEIKTPQPTQSHTEQQTTTSFDFVHSLTLPTLTSPTQQIISQLVPYSAEQITNIYNFLKATVTQLSFSNAQIYRVQKFSYGYRIVFMIETTYYQFILQSYSSTSYKLMSMQKVTQEQAESVNQLSQLISIELDDDLQALIMKTIPSSKIGIIKRIYEIKLRIETDGFYYEMVIDTDSSKSYYITIYFKPEQNYNEILSYEQIDSQYYLSQSDLAQINEYGFDLSSLQGIDNDLLTVLDFVNTKFGNNFSAYAVLYIYRSAITQLNYIRYRIGFKSASGVYYELIVALVRGSSTPILLKYTKLYDGFSLISADSSIVNSVIQFYKSILSAQIKSVHVDDYQVENVLVKEVPNIGYFYKLIFRNNFNFSITIFVNAQGVMRIYGVQGISSYYSILIKISTITYGDLATLIQNIRIYLTPKPIPQVTQPIVTAPTVTTTQTITYVPSVSLPSFPSVISADYSADFDFNCLRSKGNKCIACVYRYYLKNDQCVAVPDSCSTYDETTGECLTCYTGYYLTHGTCSQMNQLCEQADINGLCIKCYKDYTLLDGQCYLTKGVNSAATYNLRREQIDPLCEEYQNGVCAKCAAGTYMSKKSNSCTIFDPFAQDFDAIHEVAITCVRGYKVSPEGKCVRAQ